MVDDAKEGIELLRRAAGRNFAKAMDRAGVRQYEVEELTGSKQSAVSMWRQRGVPPKYAQAVGQFLRVNPNKISLLHNGLEEEYRDDEPAVFDIDKPVQGIKDNNNSNYTSKPYNRVLRALEDADLSTVDLALLEELIERLSRHR